MTRTAPAHVLVLDDDEGLLHLACKALQRCGYRVSTATNAERAHESLIDLPDLVIVDYDLKAAQTGLDFFRALRRAGRAIPAIMVTGFTDESRVIEALRAGVADVLPKTGDYLDYLPEAVARVLNQVELQQQLAEADFLRSREQYYRTLAEAIPQLVWTCLNSGECDFLSKQWVEYSGQAESQQLGKQWLQTVHPDDRQRVVDAWNATITSNLPYDIELRLRRHDGSYRWFKARAVPLRNAQGEVMKWFGTCTDIEDAKVAEQDRECVLAAERVARSEAERAVRIKDEFVANLSHELRTPLNAIVGWTQFLARAQADPEKIRKALEVIDRNARLQAQLVDDLLDMNRIMAGKLRLEVGNVDLGDVINDAIASVQPAANAKEIQINAVLGSAGVIRGDPARLQQVIWNLLMNAIKFTPKQGRVMVELRQSESELEVTVSDTGQGIRADFIGHVFDRFRQEDASITRKVGGLGLGLSIAKQLVELHGGHINAASAGEGLGATFYVVLPLAVLLQQDAPVAVAAAPLDIKDIPKFDGLHLLVVEDETDSRELLVHVLEQHGASVTAVQSAEQALQAYRTRKPDVIISDIGMPHQDGYDMIRRLRLIEKENAAIPAAALTALARSEDRRRALLAGFQTHIAKPVDPLELLVVVAALAGRIEPRITSS